MTTCFQRIVTSRRELGSRPNCRGMASICRECASPAKVSVFGIRLCRVKIPWRVRSTRSFSPILRRIRLKRGRPRPFRPAGRLHRRRADLTVDDFMEAVQAAESANPSDSPEQSLTRFRQLYYPGTDPESLTIREAAFDRLLPDAPFLLPDGTRRILTSKGMDRTHFNDSRSTLPRTQPPDIHSITPVPISSMRSAPVSALDTFC